MCGNIARYAIIVPYITSVFQCAMPTSQLIMLKSLALNIRNYSTQEILKRTPLYELHKKNNAKFFNFHGWEMPLQYSEISEEHEQCRKRSALFDVSHMLQTKVYGADRYNFVEKFVTGDIRELAPNKGTLTLITNQDGGIEEDLIVTNSVDDQSLTIVSNAHNALKVKEILLGAQDSMKSGSGKHHPDVRILYPNNALLAIQGPWSERLLSNIPALGDQVTRLPFMHSLTARDILGHVGTYTLTRCGYTGEDGFELSGPNDVALALTKDLLANLPETALKLAGFAARDLLRLECGLCLCGVDIDEHTTPLEAGLAWTIGKRRSRDLDFPGATKIMKQISDSKMGATNFSYHKRMGLIMERKGGPLPRHGYKLYSDSSKTKIIGVITSGNFSPALQRNIAMGYVDTKYSSPDKKIYFSTPRGRTQDIHEIFVTNLPFVPTKYHKHTKAPTPSKG